MTNSEKLFISLGLVLACISTILLIDNTTWKTEYSERLEKIVYTQYLNLQNKTTDIITLKRVIEEPKFAKNLFGSCKNYEEYDKIIFGNLTISSSYVTVRDSLFVCIGDFEHGIYISDNTENILVSSNLIMSGYGR
jgi:hypothetical protein